jgi:hypothetical protein
VVAIMTETPDASAPNPEEEGITRYLTTLDFAARMGWHKSTFYHLRTLDNGIWVPDPDVRIDKIVGWSEHRIISYGIDIGRLAMDRTINTDSKRPPGGMPGFVVDGKVLGPGVDPPTRWRFRTRNYLSQAKCGERLGTKDSGMAVYFLRRRGPGKWGNFIKPAVVVGDIYGWDEADVVQYGQRTGRLDRNGKVIPKPRQPRA